MPRQSRLTTADLVRGVLKRPRMLRGPRIERRLDAYPVLTSRLVLRPHTMDDADAWFALQSNRDVVRHLSWPLRSPEESRVHLAARTKHTRLWQTDDFFALAIELDGELIGDVSMHLRDVSRSSRTVELSWILDPRFGGHGYALEAALAMARLAFDRIDAKTVKAVIEAGNTRSIALARRLGFSRAQRHGQDIVMLLGAAGFRHRLEREPRLRALIDPQLALLG